MKRRRRVRGNLQRIIFLATINTLLCRTANKIRLVLSQHKRPSASCFSARSTLIESSRARRTEAIDVPRLSLSLSLLSSVKLGSYPVYGLYGARNHANRRRAMDYVGFVVRTASPSTDPKRNADERARQAALARELPDENSIPLFSISLPTQLRLRVRSFAHPRKPPPPISCVARITLAA